MVKWNCGSDARMTKQLVVCCGRGKTGNNERTCPTPDAETTTVLSVVY